MNNLIDDLRALGSFQKSLQLQRFFKTGPGQYGEGDIFWGATVPQIRTIAKKYKLLEVEQIEKLLEHKVHEVRLCALLIMILRFRDFPEKMYDLFIKKIGFINNWDLIDLSAPSLVGNFLIGKDCSILYHLAQSEILWERRISIISTFTFIKRGISDPTLNIAKILMNDKEDLIHKAVGWMLREIGKRVSENLLETFLEDFASKMPRTMLRYAVERMSKGKKEKFMQKKRKLNHYL